jgi:AAA domain/NrS-1  polymerase HBD domain
MQEGTCKMTATTVQDKPNIPADMLEESRWVAWAYVPREDKRKPDKVPVNPATGHNASSTDPATWGTYAEAQTRAVKSGLAGVGFMLGDGWVGIDFDNFRDEASGYLFQPVPQAVACFKTYAEVSPSKSGVKIIGRGKMPEGLRSRSHKEPKSGRQIEVYDRARFFTVTGERLDDAPLEVTEMPEEFEDFCRKFLPEKNRAGDESEEVAGPGSLLSDGEVIEYILSRDGERGVELRQMWEGSVPHRFAGDESRADASLMNALVYYTGGDLDQADRVFRKSGLYREKWVRADYRLLTYTFAMSGRGPDDFYHAGDTADEPAKPSGSWRGRVVSLGRRGRPPERVWVVRDLIPEKKTSVIYGGGSNGKSFLMADLMLTLIDPHADRWLGLEAATRPVLYADFEQDEDEMYRRFWKLARGRGLEEVPEGVQYLYRGARGTREVVADILGWGEENGGGVVILDSVGFAIEGDSEKASDVMNFYRQHVSALEAAGLTPLLIDHQSKIVKGEQYFNKTQFGSVYKFNSARSVFQSGGDYSGGVFRGKIKHQKSNVGPYIADIGFEVRFEDADEKIVVAKVASIPSCLQTERTAEQKIIHALEGSTDGLTVEQLVEETQVIEKTVQNTLKAMEKGGFAEVAGKAGKNKVWKAREMV